MALALTAGVAVFTGKAVATSIISSVVTKAFKYLEEYEKMEGMEAVRNRLFQTLPQVEAVLGAVEREKIKDQNKALDDWLWQLRDAVQEAEDVTNLIEYYELEKKLQVDVGTLVKYTNKVKEFVKHDGSRNVLKRLREAVKGLNNVASSVTNFIQLVSMMDGNNAWYQPSVVSDNRETSSLLTENVVYGRDEEKEMIIGWLTKTVDHVSGSSPVNVSAFTIVGMGGIGKTTLAQLIYDDKRVKDNFTRLVWVCVSDNSHGFDVLKITRNILDGMGQKTELTNTFNMLHKMLKEKVMSERYLLVLDDVWNDEDSNEWGKLVAPLKFGRPGSKILLTTRTEPVADLIAKVFDQKKESLILCPLPEADYMMLVNKHAFHGKDINNYKNLQIIGEKIAQRLGGSPLAAKVMGGLLNSNMDVGHWKSILTGDIINLEQGQKGIMQVLRLSYFRLNPCLKQCFRFCSIFRQDYQFKEAKLVQLWMTSGFFEGLVNGNKSLEDVGREILQQLTSKCFFDRKVEGDRVRYVMHDLVHDLARSVSLGECLRVTGISTVEIRKSARHLNIEGMPIHILKEMALPKNLRTLMVRIDGRVSRESEQLLSNALKRTKNLRVLKLKSIHAYCKLNDAAIRRLLHLRYMSYKMYKIEENKTSMDLFPQSIFKLYQLQVLDFSTDYYFCENIKVDGIGKLVNLRHLCIPVAMMYNIPCIGKLTNLQELGFPVGKNNGYKISELVELRNLHTLSLSSIENIAGPKVALEAKLLDKEKMKNLEFSWSDGSFGDPDLNEQIFDNLKPNESLEKLSIGYFNGFKLACWITESYLKNLTFLGISHCKNLECFSIAAPNCCMFPQLKSLIIRNCPNLKELPPLHLNLRHLHLFNVGLIILPELYRSSRASSEEFQPPNPLTTLVIENCQNLTSLNGLFHEHLQSLKYILIQKCSSLVHVPNHLFGKITSLETLNLMNCPNLVAHEIEGNLLPSTLKHLCLESCGQVDKPIVRSLAAVTSLSTLVLRGCENITTLSLRISGMLNTLEIISCPKLVDALRNPPSGPDNWVEEGSSLQVETLKIDDTHLLLIEPLRNLCFVKNLTIHDCSRTFPEQWILQNRTSLKDVLLSKMRFRFLPPCISDLCSLQKLSINKSSLLESIPEKMPKSLQDLKIGLCNPVLLERCKRNTGLDWQNIQHINRVKIDRYFPLLESQIRYYTPMPILDYYMIENEL